MDVSKVVESINKIVRGKVNEITDDQKQLASANAANISTSFIGNKPTVVHLSDQQLMDITNKMTNQMVANVYRLQ